MRPSDNGRGPIRLVAAAGLIVCWLALLRPALKGDGAFGLFQDGELLLGPLLGHMARSLRAGTWPYWIDTVMGGVPLYNAAQLSAWYPFYFAYVPGAETAFDTIGRLHVLVLLHLVIFEVNTYFLLRTIPVSRSAAVLGAVMLALGADTRSYADWLNIVAPYAWLPLYVGALVRTFRPQRTYAIVVGACALALLTLASPAQALIHAVLITAMFVTYRSAVHAYRGEWRIIASRLSRLATMSTLAMLLSAPAWLPVVAEFNGMIRWLGDEFPPVVGTEQIPFGAFLEGALAPRQLAGVVWPLQEQHIIGHEYLGFLPLALALLGVVSRRRRNVVIPFALLATYSLLSATGADLGFAYANYHIPLVKMIREPGRFLVLFALGATISAAVGFDYLRTRLRHGFRHRDWLATGVVIIIAVVALFSGNEFALGRVVALGSVLAYVAALALSLRVPQLARHALAVSIFVAALLSQYLFVSWQPAPLGEALYFKPESLSLQGAMQRVAQFDPRHQYRTLIDPSVNQQQAAMIGSWYGVRTLNAYLNPLPLRQFQEMYYHGPSPSEAFRAMGGRFLICRDCARRPVVGYQLRNEQEGLQILESKDASPLYYVRSSVDGEYSDWSEFQRRVTGRPLANGVLFVPSEARQAFQALEHDPGGPNCSVREEHRDLNSVAISFNCSTPHAFVLNQFAGGQWKASVTGVPARIFEVNGNQMAVLIEGGGVVQFDYAPRIVRIAIYMFVSGLVILAAFTYRAWKSRPSVTLRQFDVGAASPFHSR